MDGGISSVIPKLETLSVVTNPFVQLISRQLQWSDDEVQWEREGGFSHCCLSLSRMACSSGLVLVVCELPRKGKEKKETVNIRKGSWEGHWVVLDIFRRVIEGGGLQITVEKLNAHGLRNGMDDALKRGKCLEILINSTGY